MEVVKFTIPVRGTPKARPRVTRRGTYMPPAYVNAKNVMRSFAPDLGLCGDVAISLVFKFTKRNHGDIDNLAGTVFDAFNGKVWSDDRQVKWSFSRIEYGDVDCIDVVLWELEG